MQFFTKIEKRLNLSINRALSGCYKIEHSIAGVQINKNSNSQNFKVSNTDLRQIQLVCTPKFYKGIFRNIFLYHRAKTRKL